MKGKFSQIVISQKNFKMKAKQLISPIEIEITTQNPKLW